MEPLPLAATQLGLNFINNLTAPAGTNAALSPWSLMSLLSLLLLGAGPQSPSHKELTALLGSQPETAPHDQHHERMQLAQQSLVNAVVNASSPVQFSQANLLAVNKDLVQLNPRYLDSLKTLYPNSQVEEFQLGQGLPLHERVNSWASKATRGMISQLAEPSASQDPSLAFALANAAYFKGDWLRVFAETRKSSFFNVNLTSKDALVDTVSLEAEFEYAEFDVPQKPSWLLSFFGASQETPKPAEPTPEEKHLSALTKDLHCKALVLPYALNEGKEFSMLLLLPHKYDGVETLQRKLNATILDAIYRSLRPQKVRVTVPKFSLDSKLDARQVLASMGLNNLLSPRPELNELFATGSGNIQIGKLLHSTKIRLDERGSEAASASYVEGVLTSLSSMPTTFFANHPFLFLIRHTPTQLPLFLGRVCNP